MMRLKLLFSIILFVLFSCSGLRLHAQDDRYKAYQGKDTGKKEIKFPDWKKAFIGGNLGLQFGSFTFVDISPLAGYNFDKKFTAGIGVTYQYLSNNVSNFSTNIYGGRVFGRYNFTENLFGHLEYEVLNMGIFEIVGGKAVKLSRINITSIFVGGGYRQSIGGRSFVSVMLLWNINDSAFSPYQNPIYRMGIHFGM